MRARKHVLHWAVLSVAIVLLAATVALTLSGLRVNTTRSIPVGLYVIVNAPVQTGAYVMLCPPATEVFRMARQRNYIGAGFCPDGYGYLMKRVAAVGSDTVRMDSAGVWVNEVLWPHSRTLDNDSLGRPLQVSAPLEPNVPEDAVLLMSDDSPTSFDARYFGLVDRRQIQAVIRPVLTW